MQATIGDYLSLSTAAASQGYQRPAAECPRRRIAATSHHRTAAKHQRDGSVVRRASRNQPPWERSASPGGSAASWVKPRCHRGRHCGDGGAGGSGEERDLTAALGSLGSPLPSDRGLSSRLLTVKRRIVSLYFFVLWSVLYVLRPSPAHAPK